MKKILIADDDAAMRIGLKTILDWNAYGFQISGEASDGREALELWEKCRPQIILTDMKMPGMDGVDFLRELRKRINPSKAFPHVIVLSGYDDFALVRESMKLGAADYILKLELTGKRLLEALQAAPATAPEDENPENLPRKDRGILQAHLLREIICHFYEDAGECAGKMTDAEIIFSETGQEDQTGLSVWCFLIKAGELYRFEEADAQEAARLQQALQTVSEEILRDCMRAYYAPGKTGELYIFASLREEYRQIRDLPYRLAKRLRQMLRQFLDLSCTICISCGTGNPDSMFSSALQVQDLMRQRFLYEEDRILRADELHDCGAETLVPSGTGQPARLAEAACRWIGTAYAQELSLSIAAREFGVSPGYLSATMKKQTGKGFTDYLNQVRIDKARELLSSGDETLQVIAEAVGYTDQYYFSRQFKKATGVSPGSWRRSHLNKQ